MQWLNTLIFILSLLISVSFLTLLERKILSYIQIRKGPNKVSIMGILQPFSDALKLLHKTLSLSTPTNQLSFSMAPPMTLTIALLYSITLPMQNPTLTNNILNLLAFIIISSMMVYPMIMIGWAPNSKFSNLGTMRAIAQLISYEISMFLLILAIIMLYHSYNMNNFNSPQFFTWSLLGIIPLFLIWMSIMLAELNRTPFDFAEGESELVSGFNVEYMGGLFALAFLAEYTAITAMMIFTSNLFTSNSSPLTTLFLLSLIIITLWARSSLPRFRFDLLMSFNWALLLPLAISLTPTFMLLSLHSF